MRETEELAQLILQRFIQNGVAHSTNKYYKFVELIPYGVRILRETGVLWDIKKEYIVMAINAVRNEPAIYSAGPSRLQPYINQPIRSPIWAMLHLLTLDEILN